MAWYFFFRLPVRVRFISTLKWLAPPQRNMHSTFLPQSQYYLVPPASVFLQLLPEFRAVFSLHNLCSIPEHTPGDDTMACAVNHWIESDSSRLYIKFGSADLACLQK